MSLFSELKRRNVFRIGVAYLIVAWLLMQVTDLAAPALRLPDWVTTFVVFILALGFPVALLLAWAFELTPDGIQKTKDVPLEKSVRQLKGQRLNFVVIALLAIAVIVLLVDRTRLATTDSGGQVTDAAFDPSLAVLPFDNMSDDPEQEHFADGLTEELLNSLATIDGLRLVSKTSSFTFKDSNLAVDEIASRLGVAHILEGSVRRAGNNIRITAQLIEAGSDTHLWSDTYDRALTVENLFDIQEDVADAVSRVLHASLRTANLNSLVLDQPASIEAFDYYLAGINYVRRLELGDADPNNADEYYEAVAAFEESIKLDPNWAPSHAGLGRATHFMMHLDREAQLERAREHVLEAIRLDEGYGPAWASLGYIETMSNNFDAAFDAYSRARAARTRSHWGLAILLGRLGRYDQSVSEYLRAEEWDPLSVPVKGQLLYSLACADRIPELLTRSERYVEDYPEQSRGKVFRAYALARNGDYAGALEAANDVAIMQDSDLRVLDTLAIVGERERVLTVIREMEGSNAWWGMRSTAAAILGETDLAIDILEANEERMISPGADIRCGPYLRSLAGNPRYDAFVERLDLPE